MVFYNDVDMVYIPWKENFSYKVVKDPNLWFQVYGFENEFLFLHRIDDKSIKGCEVFEDSKY